jgi:hypothetical protein
MWIDSIVICMVPIFRQSLKRARVMAIFQQMRGERVLQHMAADYPGCTACQDAARFSACSSGRISTNGLLSFAVSP